jgi:hypothetical protein
MPSSRLCNCSKYCGNPPKTVSLSTYNRHASYRELDSCTPAFHAFLSRLDGSSLAGQKCAQPRLSDHPQKRTRKGKGKEYEPPESISLESRPTSPPRSSSSGPSGSGSGSGLSSDSSGFSPRPSSPSDPTGVSSHPEPPAASDLNEISEPNPGSLQDEGTYLNMNPVYCLNSCS